MKTYSVVLRKFQKRSTWHSLNVMIFSFSLLLLTNLVSPILGSKGSQVVSSSGSIKYLYYVGGNVGFGYDPYFWDNVDALSFNAVRLYVGNFSISPEEVKEFLYTAKAHGIKAIVSLPNSLRAFDLNGTLDLNKTKQNIYDFIVNGELKGNSEILAWDVASEPDLGDPQTLNTVLDVSRYVKSIDPDTPVTIGGWRNSQRAYPWHNPEDIALIVNDVDIVSPHIYLEPWQLDPPITPETSDQEIGGAIYSWVKSRVQQHLNHSEGKPTIVEEFGISITWLQQTVGPERAESVEAIYYNATLKAISETWVHGMIFWSYIVGTDFCPIELDNHWRQAAYVIKEYFTKINQ